MEKRTRQVDGKARATLFRDFAGAKITIERVSPTELRVRKLPARKRKYSLKDLVAGITPRNRHRETSTGRRVGGEAW